MQNKIFQRGFEKLLMGSSVTIDGKQPWDIRVHDPRTHRKAMLEGNLGLGESYMDGWWDCDDLEELFFRMISANVEQRLFTVDGLMNTLGGVLFNLQKPSRAFTVGKRHYDAGNDLFRAMLDPLMIYSCAYWNGATSLEKAQENKLRLVFDKLAILPEMKVLDIGCGWGGAAKFAAEHYGANVLGITISREQATFAEERCRDHDVEIRFMDYRNLEGTFDRIYSLGMLEHVGHKNLRTFFDMARRCLKPDGRLLVQSIGGNLPSMGTDPWINRYIFPNSMIPSASQIATAYEPRFVLEDWHSFSFDYTLTLRAWRRNFMHRWPELKHHYDERFYRMWQYYLQSCAGAFRARSLQLWQVLLTPCGIRGDYRVQHDPAMKHLFTDRDSVQAQLPRTYGSLRWQQRESPRSGAAPES
ncbi:MAG: cyclopropane fatty acyl phospholipid synthase [Chlorobiaceae bacterium]|nr:cyclopropane fatty acyl phospholipid synthase [Chlorobiaceae bacterium]NTW74930.1 cyclopropane fatty acyl phospholipid synthase [Chlorobiaceae bacterium]